MASLPDPADGPTAAVQRALLELHARSGLPWWATIASATVGVRTCLVPFAVVQARACLSVARARALSNARARWLFRRQPRVMRGSR